MGMLDARIHLARWHKPGDDLHQRRRAMTTAKRPSGGKVSDGTKSIGAAASLTDEVLKPPKGAKLVKSSGAKAVAASKTGTGKARATVRAALTAALA